MPRWGTESRHLIETGRFRRINARAFCPMDEHRGSPRLRTFKGGAILFGTAVAVECIIRNMSDTGACLEVTSLAGIPDTFTLLIRPELRKRACAVVWRSAQKIGVRFACRSLRLEFVAVATSIPNGRTLRPQRTNTPSPT